MIVIDVGCARYGADYSIERLVEMFRPAKVYGFDPAQGLGEYPWEPNPKMANLEVAIYKGAAWTYTGEVRFQADGLVGHIVEDESAPLVPCIDLAAFIEEMPEGPVILKIDAEGAEYELLEHLIDTGSINRLTRLLVEWHPRHEGKRRRAIEEGLRRAEVVTEQWRW